MGKGNRVRTQRQAEPVKETHEPHVPVNWPKGHVDVEITGPEDDECFIVIVHGVKHYLHATTARALWFSLGRKLDEFNDEARAILREQGVIHEDV